MLPLHLALCHALQGTETPSSPAALSCVERRPQPPAQASRTSCGWACGLGLQQPMQERPGWRAEYGTPQHSTHQLLVPQLLQLVLTRLRSWPCSKQQQRQRASLARKAVKVLRPHVVAGGRAAAVRCVSAPLSATCWRAPAAAQISTSTAWLDGLLLTSKSRGRARGSSSKLAVGGWGAEWRHGCYTATGALMAGCGS